MLEIIGLLSGISVAVLSLWLIVRLARKHLRNQPQDPIDQ